jgi:hypothetical protein
MQAIIKNIATNDEFILYPDLNNIHFENGDTITFYDNINEKMVTYTLINKNIDINKHVITYFCNEKLI